MESESKENILKRKRSSSRMCCVVNCSNTETSNPELSFYSFPGRSYEIERRKQWIAAVRRVGEKNKPWEPSVNTRICSAHFDGGLKSDNPQKVNFIPTIFPDVYGQNKKYDYARAKGLKERNENKQKIFTSTRSENSNDDDSMFDITQSHMKKLITTVEISMQTDLTFDVPRNINMIELFCSSDGNDKGTQSNIQLQCYPSIEDNITIDEEDVKSIILPKLYKTVACGSDKNLPNYFAGFSGIKDDNEMKVFTGITSDVFNILLDFIIPGKDGQPAYFKKLEKEDRLLLFLMKLKLGTSFSALALLFGIKRQTVSAIFFSVLDTLFKNLKNLIFWPSKEAIKDTMPDTFINYPNSRAIIDCTEVYTDTPSKVEERILMFSYYKGGYTVKFLLGISPSGMITFISRGYSGRSTDAFIVNDSGFLNYLEAGDETLADKGFPQIKADVLQRDCTLVIPPFAFQPQFTKEEVEEGSSIASVRIHVERAILRVKIFKILQHINNELFELLDEIMYVICALVNLKEPLIKKDKNRND